MNEAKYMRLDVPQAMISVAVLDSAGNLVMEEILKTKGEHIPQYIHGLRGNLHVTMEEGTRAAWLHDLLEPHVTQVFVCDLLAEGRKHGAMKLLRQILSIGPIRSVLLIALMLTLHRFRTRRQLWAYCGLALKTSTRGEYRIVEGQRKCSKKFLTIRGLNQNHNHDLNNIFKGAAIRAAAVPGPSQEFHTGLVARGIGPTLL